MWTPNGLIWMPHGRRHTPWCHPLLGDILECPFPYMQKRALTFVPPEVDRIQKCTTLQHLNWSICSPWKLFSTSKFPLFQNQICNTPFSCIQRNGQWSQKVNETKGCMTLGHSNWIISSQQNLFYIRKFPTFFVSHMQHISFTACRETRRFEDGETEKEGRHTHAVCGAGHLNTKR